MARVAIEILEALRIGEDFQKAALQLSKEANEKTELEMIERRVKMIEYFRLFTVKMPGSNPLIN